MVALVGLYTILVHFSHACKVRVFSTYCFMLSRFLLISFINELAVEKPFRGVQFCRSSSGLHTVQGFTPLMFGSTANTGFGH